jgi:hypothetical protein
MVLTGVCVQTTMYIWDVAMQVHRDMCFKVNLYHVWYMHAYSVTMELTDLSMLFTMDT